MTDALVHIAEGAEQSRRVAWAKYYALAEELDRWRDPDSGEATTYVPCPCCGLIVELVVALDERGFQDVRYMRHIGPRHKDADRLGIDRRQMDNVSWALQ